MLKVPGIGMKVVELLSVANTFARAEEELQRCSDEGIRVVLYSNADYPAALRSIFDAPLVLYARGGIDFNERPAVAVVGTRRPSQNGRETAERIGKYLGENGVTVVSGLAYGVDIAAHRAAMEAGGSTVAVLGHGIDRVYPAQHRADAKRMLQRGGLVTNYVTGTKPDACNFPARNRIISGLSRAIIVIEAQRRGGALITANFGFEQNREIYAVPGDIRTPNAQGCNNLIRDNVAKLLTDPAEVLEDLGITAPPKKQITESEFPLSADERKVMKTFGDQPMRLAEIGIKAGIAVGDLMAVLLALECKGMVKQRPGGRFERL